MFTKVASQTWTVVNTWRCSFSIYSDVDIEAQFTLNQSRMEEITLPEEYGNMPLEQTDDGFGDMGNDTDAPDFVRANSNLEPSMEQVFFPIGLYFVNWTRRRYLCLWNEYFQSNVLFSEGPVLDGVMEAEPIPSTSGTQHHTPMQVDEHIHDGFEANLDQNIICKKIKCYKMFNALCYNQTTLWYNFPALFAIEYQFLDILCIFVFVHLQYWLFKC